MKPHLPFSLGAISRRLAGALAYRRFCREWRRHNPHNFTTPGNIFDASKVSVGNFTYGSICIREWDVANERLEIGHFCSIAANVTFLLSGNKPTSKFCTYPLKRMLLGASGAEGFSKGPIHIGDDVWFGHGVTVLSGVTVGRGAVIGAMALVATDLPAYSICVGNPAKPLRQRFPDCMVEKLMTVDFARLTPALVAEMQEVLYHDLSPDSLDVILRRLASAH